MKIPVLPFAMVLQLFGASLHAESVYVMDRRAPDYRLVRIDVDSGAILFEDSDSHWAGIDLAVGEDGDVYFANSGALFRTPPSGDALGPLVPAWAVVQDACETAFRSSGELLSVDRAQSTDSYSAVVLLSRDGAETWRDAVPGYDIMGADVARAGPLEDGILALAVDPVGSWWTFRWQQQPDGVWLRTGPIGPLFGLLAPPCPPYFACAVHPTFSRDGESFYVIEPSTNTLSQYALDGRFPMSAVVIPQDPSASGGFRDTDLLSNVSPLPDGGVMAVTQRRLYRLDAAGSIVYRLDRMFHWLSAIAPAEWIPFESAGVRCRPFSTGFWKRQCASLGMRPRRLGARGPRGSALHPPPLHPAMTSIVDLAATVERANGWLEPYALTACTALQPDAPSNWREKALRRYAAVALNFENRTSGPRCPVTVDGASRTTGDVLDEVRLLLSSASDDELKRAFHLAGRLLNEEGE